MRLQLTSLPLRLRPVLPDPRIDVERHVELHRARHLLLHQRRDILSLSFGASNTSSSCTVRIMRAADARG